MPLVFIVTLYDSHSLKHIDRSYCERIYAYRHIWDEYVYYAVGAR